MTFTRNQIAALERDLEPGRVKVLKGNSYIEGWDAIDRANRIFGFDGWSCETVEMEQLCPSYKNKNGNNVVCYGAKVRVTAGGVIREGSGFGSGVAGDLGTAFEGAIKEAETDATKRALTRFGYQFGLALYDEHQTNVEGTPANERKKADAYDLTPWEAKIAEADSQAALFKIGDEIAEEGMPDGSRRTLAGVWTKRRKALNEAEDEVVQEVDHETA